MWAVSEDDNGCRRCIYRICKTKLSIGIREFEALLSVYKNMSFPRLQIYQTLYSQSNKPGLVAMVIEVLRTDLLEPPFRC